jgi:hypothetical protein
VIKKNLFQNDICIFAVFCLIFFFFFFILITNNWTGRHHQSMLVSLLTLIFLNRHIRTKLYVLHQKNVNKIFFFLVQINLMVRFFVALNNWIVVGAFDNNDGLSDFFFSERSKKTHQKQSLFFFCKSAVIFYFKWAIIWHKKTSTQWNFQLICKICMQKENPDSLCHN